MAGKSGETMFNHNLDPMKLATEREKIYLFDLDGTITAKEILPELGRLANMHAELLVLTQATMSGAVPFAESLRLRVEVLGGLSLDDVHGVVMAIPVRETLMNWIQQHREQVWIVTSNLNIWVQPLLERWGLKAFTSHGVLTDGRISVPMDGILDKSVIPRMFPEFKVIAIGDGANDETLLEESDFGIAFAHRSPSAKGLIDVADCVVTSEEALCQVLSRL